MKNVAVICEYNPYHNGHLRQANELYLRGAETVTGILGATFSQRGTPYLLNAWARAEAAVSAGGCDLVFSLPSPFSSASAKVFAMGGVSIASRLGYIDTLAFGCESEDETLLYRAAERLDRADRNGELREDADAADGTPKAIAKLYANAFGEEAARVCTKPNNTLAIAYLIALNRLSSPLNPVFVHRTDVQHDGTANADTASSSFIRANLTIQDTVSRYMPRETLRVLEREKAAAHLADLKNAERVVLDRLRFLPAIDNCAEASGGLDNRIRASAETADSLDALFSSVSTKGYTNARVRRAVLSMLLGVTEEDEQKRPSFTLLLGANRNGLSVFHGAKPKIPVVSCPADLEKSVGDARALELYRRAEALYALCTERIQPSGTFRLNKPYIAP